MGRTGCACGPNPGATRSGIPGSCVSGVAGSDLAKRTCITRQFSLEPVDRGGLRTWHAGNATVRPKHRDCRVMHGLAGSHTVRSQPAPARLPSRCPPLETGSRAAGGAGILDQPHLGGSALSASVTTTAPWAPVTTNRAAPGPTSALRPGLHHPARCALVSGRLEGYGRLRRPGRRRGYGRSARGC